MEENKNINNEENKDDVLTKISKIEEEITYLKDLFQRRLLNNKNNENLVNAVKEHLDLRLEIDRGESLISVFKEILHVVDYLESDLDNEINLNLADQIVTVFRRRGFDVIDMNNIENPIYYEIYEVEESENVSMPEIASLLSKGYTLNGKVIRPAKVKVYKPFENKNN